MGSVAPRAIARIEHSEQLLAILRARVAALGLTHETLDSLSGLPGGYTSKLLADPPLRRMGHFSLFLMLQTLALDIVLLENPERLEILLNPAHRRRQRFLLAKPRITVFTPDFRRLNGIKGGQARAKKLSAKRLSQIARRANRVRWARVRAAAAAASQPAPAST